MFRFVLRVLLCLLPLSCVAAHADTTTYLVSFTVQGNQPASATFQIQLDPTLSYTDATTLTVGDGAVLPQAGQIGFSYDPAQNGGTLSIGGLRGGVAQLWDEDFLLSINNLSSQSPVFDTYSWSSGPMHGNGSNLTGTVTEIAATPEPSSLLLLGTGALGAFGCVRRRFAA